MSEPKTKIKTVQTQTQTQTQTTKGGCAGCGQSGSAHVPTKRKGT